MTQLNTLYTIQAITDKSTIDVSVQGKAYYFEYTLGHPQASVRNGPPHYDSFSSGYYYQTRDQQNVNNCDKIWEFPYEIYFRHMDKYVFSVSGNTLTVKLKPHASDEILSSMFGSSFNNRHVWRNNCAQWKAIGPREIPSEYYEALHQCFYFEGQEHVVKGLSQFDSLLAREGIEFPHAPHPQPHIERLAKLIANHLHPYDETANTYGIHEHLSQVDDAVHYFKQVCSALLATNKVGYGLHLTDEEFIKTYIENVLPSIRFAFSSANNQTGTPLTVTITKERLTGGTIGWQKLVSGKWTDIENQSSATYTPTEAVPHRVKLARATTSGGSFGPIYYSQSVNLMAPPAALSLSIATINSRINTPIVATPTETSIRSGYVINWEVERRAGRLMEWVSAAPRGATGIQFTPTFEGRYRSKIENAVGTDGTDIPAVYSNEVYIT